MERWPPNKIAKSLSIKHNSGINASSLISPDSQNPFYKRSSSTSTTNNKTNHQQLYRKALKDMQLKKEEKMKQQKIKEQQEVEKMNRLKKKHYEKIKSKVFDNIQRINTPISVYERKLSSTFDSANYNPFNVESNDKENVGVNKSRNRMSYPLKKSQERLRANSSKNNSASPKNYLARKSYGKIPDYIKERKAELAEEQKRREDIVQEDGDDDADQNNASSAADMVRMSESERLETLHLLDEAETKVKSELLKLPLALQTHGAIKKRDKLETKLNELEEAREIFSREKVYIQQV